MKSTLDIPKFPPNPSKNQYMSEASGSWGLRSQTISHQNNNNINVLILKSLILILKN